MPLHSKIESDFSYTDETAARCEAGVTAGPPGWVYVSVRRVTDAKHGHEVAHFSPEAAREIAVAIYRAADEAAADREDLREREGHPKIKVGQVCRLLPDPKTADGGAVYFTDTDAVIVRGNPDGSLFSDGSVWVASLRQTGDDAGLRQYVDPKYLEPIK